MKIVIIDYGMGNIKSIIGALKYIGVTDIKISNSDDDIQNADKLILPGVGSFAEAMLNIQKKKLDIYLKEAVLENKKPILGICLGMQLMSMSSTENGNSKGLGFIDGHVTRFAKKQLKIPHVGFNQIKINTNAKLYREMTNEADFYFTHSYKLESDKNINQSNCFYGEDFIASFEIDNLVGAQYHPELSQSNGLKVLSNFIKNF